MRDGWNVDGVGMWLGMGMGQVLKFVTTLGCCSAIATSKRSPFSIKVDLFAKRITKSSLPLSFLVHLSDTDKQKEKNNEMDIIVYNSKFGPQVHKMVFKDSCLYLSVDI